MKVRTAVLSLVLAAVLGLAGGLTANGRYHVTIDLNDGASTTITVPAGATLQVVRLAPEDAPLKLLVVTHVHGETSAQLQFLTMDVIDPDRRQPRAIDPVCPPSFVPTIDPGGCVPPNHPLARPRR